MSIDENAYESALNAALAAKSQEEKIAYYDNAVKTMFAPFKKSYEEACQALAPFNLLGIQSPTPDVGKIIEEFSADPFVNPFYYRVLRVGYRRVRKALTETQAARFEVLEKENLEKANAFVASALAKNPAMLASIVATLTKTAPTTEHVELDDIFNV